MMVYIVDRKENGYSFIHGVFSSEKYAKKYVEEYFDKDDDYIIMEFDIDGMLPYLTI